MLPERLGEQVPARGDADRYRDQDVERATGAPGAGERHSKKRSNARDSMSRERNGKTVSIGSQPEKEGKKKSGELSLSVHGSARPRAVAARRRR